MWFRRMKGNVGGPIKLVSGFVYYVQETVLKYSETCCTRGSELSECISFGNKFSTHYVKRPIHAQLY
jgi:hypothetical protein